MPPGPRRLSRRSLLGLATGTVVAAGGAWAGVRVVGRESDIPEDDTVATGIGEALRIDGTESWSSGSSGPPAADGRFAQWRGRAVDIIGTWADTNEAMVELWQLQPGAELSEWTGDLDIAVGAIGDGESWLDAAAGAYDDRWQECLGGLARLRADASGTTYVRFAHELNGDWYPWRVDAGSATHLVTAWQRFRRLQLDILPEGRLVFNVNRESVGAGLDWRRLFPGTDEVDLFSVDYYNQSPFIRTLREWDESLEVTDSFGAPKGLARHLEFARSVGLPVAISEWSSDSNVGDSPVFMAQFHDFLRVHSGAAPGQISYEIGFNTDRDDNRWSLFPQTRMPDSAETYR